MLGFLRPNSGCHNRVEVRRAAGKLECGSSFRRPPPRIGAADIARNHSFCLPTSSTSRTSPLNSKNRRRQYEDPHRSLRKSREAWIAPNSLNFQVNPFLRCSAVHGRLNEKSDKPSEFDDVWYHANASQYENLPGDCVGSLSLHGQRLLTFVYLA